MKLCFCPENEFAEVKTPAFPRHPAGSVTVLSLLGYKVFAAPFDRAKCSFL